MFFSAGATARAPGVEGKYLKTFLNELFDISCVFNRWTQLSARYHNGPSVEENPIPPLANTSDQKVAVMFCCFFFYSESN